MSQTKSVAIPSKRSQGRNILHALALKQKGLSWSQVATLTGEPESTIRSRLNALSDVLQTPVELQSYNDQRANLLDSIAAKYMGALAARNTDDVSAKDLTIIWGILYDKSRLERGKATAHIAVLASLIGASDKGLFASKQGIDEALHASKQHVKENDTADNQCRITRKPSTDTTATQQIVERPDTPTTRQGGGPGGMDVSEGAVVTHDLHILQKDSEINGLEDPHQ